MQLFLGPKRPQKGLEILQWRYQEGFLIHADNLNYSYANDVAQHKIYCIMGTFSLVFEAYSIICHLTNGVGHPSFPHFFFRFSKITAAMFTDFRQEMN